MAKSCLHLLWSGGVGGIEILCKEYAIQSKNNNIFVFFCSGGEIADEIENHGFPVVRLNVTKRNLFKAVKQLLQICDSAAVGTIVEHHSAPLALLCAMLVKRFRPSVKLVTYAHCNAAYMVRKQDRKRYWLYKNVIRKVFRYADLVIAISNSVKESLINELGIPENKIKKIYNGVNLARFRVSEKKEQAETRIIFVGRLIPEKGVQTILQALTLLPDTLNYNFCVAGDGVERQHLQTFAEENGLSDKVSFLGTRADVSELLYRSDIFIHMPNCEEGFGITIVEAMASGLICICSNSGAIPEIIRDGENGILVEKGNAENLAEVLTRVMQDKYPMTDAIRKRAVATAQTFSVAAFTRNLDTVIKMLGNSD